MRENRVPQLPDIERVAWVDSALSAGSSPRQATYFSLLRQRKVGKRKAAPLAVSLRFAAGSLRCSGAGRRCGTRFAALPLRSNSRSESVHEAHASLRPPHALRFSARPEGFWGRPLGPSLRLGPSFARSAVCGRMARVDAPQKTSLAQRYQAQEAINDVACRVQMADYMLRRYCPPTSNSALVI